MDLPCIDSCVVRTIRNLKKIQVCNESFPTRTNTPSNETQTIELLTNCNELDHLLTNFSMPEIYEIIKVDNIIIRDLYNSSTLSSNTIKRIENKVMEYKETTKIQEAKNQINNKIQERMEALRKKLENS